MLEQIVPVTVAAVEAFEDVPGEPPHPDEESLIAKATPGRRREFVTARRCAREALVKLGLPAGAILTGPARAPCWPAGAVGSITHCAGYRAAVIARDTDLASIGIDAEPNQPLPADVLGLVTGPAEREHLDHLARTHPAICWDRLLFSAKESVYKAWYPLTGRWLGFTEVSLTFDPAGPTFTATLLVDGARLDGAHPLTAMHGRFLAATDLVLTAVTVAGRPGG
ncbi:4'-phosphopantetheinyl transferase family protein [Micromonosporaceae bacterium Da 78-11]